MIRPDWLGPWWFERQTDPESPDFVPDGADHNVTHRSWTTLGALTSPHRASVDPKGLVNVGGDWSLDWWVGGDDRWHLPSREVAVRQRLVDGALIVETTMRVPGGDIVHRAFAVRAGEHDVLAVEIENRTPIPVALALSVRPVHPARAGRIDSLALAGPTVAVDGVPSVFFAKPPARASLSTGAGGDVMHTVVDGLAEDSREVSTSCGQGRASGGFVFPLAHSATLRLVIPLGPGSGLTGYPDDVPPYDAVARGWAIQADRGLRLTLPDEHLQEVFDASRRYLLLQVAGDEVVSPDPQSWVDSTHVLTALDRLGYHQESADVLATLPDLQGLRGAVSDPTGDPSAAAALLHALAEHWRLGRDRELVEALIGPIAKAAHWIGKRQGRVDRRGTLTGSKLVWAVRGLRDAADLALAIDQPEVAADAATAAAAAEGALVDLRAISDLLLAAELGIVAADATAVAGAVETLVERATTRFAVIDLKGGAGLSPAETIALATVELRRGDLAALDRLAWLLESSSSTWTWPEIIHPRTGEGSRGSGQHGPTIAAFCSLVRRLVVDERDGGIVLCSVVPDPWLGQPLEVRDAPTAFGRLGFAIRWHGERPALLWELDAAEGVGPVRLTIPGFDPTWSTTERSGEALLAPAVPRRPETSPPEDPPGEASSSFV